MRFACEKFLPSKRPQLEDTRRLLHLRDPCLNLFPIGRPSTLQKKRAKMKHSSRSETSRVWVAVKEFSLSYHNGYIYIVNNWVSPI